MRFLVMCSVYESGGEVCFFCYFFFATLCVADDPKIAEKIGPPFSSTILCLFCIFTVVTL